MRNRNPLGKSGESEQKSVLATVAREHTLTLLARATALTSNACDAWDLVQGAFERAARSRPPCCDRDEALRWLSVVMRNLFRDDYRARKVRRHVPLTDALSNTLPQTEREKTAPWKRISVEDLHRLTPRLSPMIRAAFVCSLKGMSAAEISGKLRIPISTVATRLFRGRQQLRRMLTDEMDDGFVSSDAPRALRPTPSRPRWDGPQLSPDAAPAPASIRNGATRATPAGFEPARVASRCSG